MGVDISFHYYWVLELKLLGIGRESGLGQGRLGLGEGGGSDLKESLSLATVTCPHLVAHGVEGGTRVCRVALEQVLLVRELAPT